MKIKIARAFLLRLYCYTHQAYRSVAFALGADWSEFLEFYRGERLEELNRLVADGYRLIDRLGLSRKSVPKAEVARTIRPLGIVRYFLGPYLASWKSHWQFSGEEFTFMVATLVALVSVLETGTRPSQEALISLRMDLCFCESVIQERCHGLAEINRASRLEHFWQAPSITPVRMADILEGKEDSEPSRKIA